MFFDERFKFVEEGSQSIRVGEAGNNPEPYLLSLTEIRAPKNGYVFVYVSNESNTPVYFDNLRVKHTRGRILEENHYYPFGLKIAGISSVKLGDVNEGMLKNQYQYQGDFSEYDDETGWNDFELRSYDAQIGRFTTPDPFDQFASGYIGMGNNPISIADPSGGLGIDFGTIGSFTGSVLADRALVTLGGAALGFGIDKLTGGNGWTGAAIGGAVGLAATFIPPFDIGNIGSALGKAAPSIAVHAADIAVQTIVSHENEKVIQSGIDNQYNVMFAGYNPNQFPSFKTLLSNYPLPYNIRPDRTPINPKLPLDDATGANFLYFNQCAIRVSLSLRRSGVSLAGAKNITNPGHSPYGNGNILGATNLAGFLLKFGTPEAYDGTKTDVVSKIRNRTGIVYFENFIEDGRRTHSATHIDLWNKTNYQSPFPFSQMFDATRILFWDIK
ncbi:MAG TPA: T6SS effector amidase Tae4 family protein [Ferruginibacter sp.]|nr:T6SS effector amidase Tae4 family protein [Ferruginibacter sp.]